MPSRCHFAKGEPLRPDTNHSATVTIRDIATYLPEQVVTNDDLHRERPQWDMARVATRAGITSRHIAAPTETALDLAKHACTSLFERNPGLRESVDGLLFCTQTPDYVMPPNSCVLHRELGLGQRVFALDTNLACSGYVYSLALAQGLIAAGTCRDVLVVTADTYSKLIHPGDRAARTLFGDGAAVSWVSRSADGTGVVDVLCETSGKGFESFYVPAGGHRTPRSAETSRERTNASGNTLTDEHINMDGMGVLSFVNSKIPGHVQALLARNGLGADDIDLFVFHQASQLALDALTRALKVPTERVFNNLRDHGNTVSASIPIALAEARAAGRVRPNTKVLLCGFGVGLSWASAILQT